MKNANWEKTHFFEWSKIQFFGHSDLAEISATKKFSPEISVDVANLQKHFGDTAEISASSTPPKSVKTIDCARYAEK